MPKIFSKNKKILFFAIGLGLILTLLSWQFVEADPIITGPDGEEYDLCEPCGPWPHQWPNCIVCFLLYIFSLPVRLIFFIIAGINALLALIGGLIYAITVALVTWLIGIILEVGIVPGNPLTPDIVSIGWDFSRQFANMFFILALAFIGLATVLRIKEYEMKKALPTLIIIALLINFTPVIVGFVVDIGNLVTKFFLDQIGSIQNFRDTMELAFNYLSTMLATIFLEDGQFLGAKFLEILAKILSVTIYGFVLVIFFFLATFIYLLVGAVFFCRTVILWVLMILSPIAFLSKVFPNTRITKMVFPDILHWDKWWEKLIQWTIIGIPISFFLYLSNSMMIAKVDIEDKFGITALRTSLEGASGYPYPPEVAAEIATIQVDFINLFASLLAPTVALVLLAMGALISLKAAPEGARGIMSFTTYKGIPTARRLVARGARAVRGEATDIRQKFQAGRALGLSRSRAMGLALQRYAQRRITPSSAAITVKGETVVPAGRKAQVARVLGIPLVLGGRAAKGILKATKDTAIAQTKKELKAKKTKEQKPCPHCGEDIPADAKFCPECGGSLS